MDVNRRKYDTLRFSVFCFFFFGGGICSWRILPNCRFSYMANFVYLGVLTATIVPPSFHFKLNVNAIEHPPPPPLSPLQYMFELQEFSSHLVILWKTKFESPNQLFPIGNKLQNYQKKNPIYLCSVTMILIMVNSLFAWSSFM